MLLIVKGLNKLKRGNSLTKNRNEYARRLRQRWEEIESIRHLELAVVLVAVPEGDGDHVVTRVGDVGDVAVGGPDVAVAYRTARGGGDVNLDVAEVLGERHREDVAVDGGVDGRGSWASLGMGYLDVDDVLSIVCFDTKCAAECY